MAEDLSEHTSGGAEYDASRYWNELSGSTMRLRDVGWPTWTEAYNAWRYRLALEQVSATIDRVGPTRPAKIVEVGCGTGFWTAFLRARFPDAEYVGADLSETAVRKLAERLGAPRASFRVADIADQAPADGDADLVVCFHVLLHIVDQDRWRAGVGNVAAAMAPGGVALVSDPIAVHSAPPEYQAGANSRVRHLDEWRRVLSDAGVEIEEIRPQTFFLDDNFDFRSARATARWRRFFGGYHRVLSIQQERLGSMLGWMAYRFDRRYARGDRMGHGSKLLALRKRR